MIRTKITIQTRAYLLQLELDSGLQLLDLGHHVITMGEHSGELSGLVQTRSQNTGNLVMKYYKDFQKRANTNSI